MLVQGVLHPVIQIRRLNQPLIHATQSFLKVIL